MQKKSLLSGAIMLSVGGVLAKIFSAVYRIVLTRILGGEGIGLYQMVFPLYSLCVVLATAGLPLAISKVIAKHPNAQNSVIKKCLAFTCTISIALSAVLVVFSKLLAKLQGEEKLYICYLILAPTIIIVGLCSVIRGIYQGKQQFTPSALSNIIEQFVKLALGLVLSLVFIKRSVFMAIIGAMISIVASEVVALLILILFFKRNKNKQTQNVPFKEIMRDVLPITFTNLLMPVAGFIDSLIVINLLMVNFSKTQSIFMYGLETGAVGSLVGLPTIFSFAIASVILPAISRKGKNKDNQFNMAVKVVILLTLPCVMLFLFAPKNLLLLLYGGRFMANQAGLNIASNLLKISGLGVIFLAINQVLSTSLQAVEKRRVSVRNLAIAVIIKFVVEVLLLPTKTFNIYALSLGNTICYLVVMLLNLIEVKKEFSFKFGFLLPVFVANIVMVMVLVFATNMFGGGISFLITLIVCALVYFASVFAFKVFNNLDKAFIKYKMW